MQFVEVEKGRFELVPATHSVKSLKGMFGKSSKTVTIEEMSEAIARRGAAAR